MAYEQKLRNVGELVAGFKKARVMVVGDVMLDRYCWGTVSRISPEAPVPVVKLTETTDAAGGAANVAANIVGLGASVILIGLSGDDKEAEELAAVIEAAGIDARHIVRARERRTTLKTRIVAHSQQVVRLDQEDSTEIDDALAALIGAAIADAIPSIDAIVVSDYAKGLLTAKLVGSIVGAAKAAGKPVFVDPKGHDYSIYRGANVITPNRKEALEAASVGDNIDGAVALAGAKLLGIVGGDAVLVTEGERGMSLFVADGKVTRFDALARKVYDVTGAGDTVIASLAVAASSGMTLVESAEFANVAAGIVVEQIGTTAITADMLFRAAGNEGESGSAA